MCRYSCQGYTYVSCGARYGTWVLVRAAVILGTFCTAGRSIHCVVKSVHTLRYGREEKGHHCYTWKWKYKESLTWFYNLESKFHISAGSHRIEGLLSFTLPLLLRMVLHSTKTKGWRKWLSQLQQNKNVQWMNSSTTISTFRLGLQDYLDDENRSVMNVVGFTDKSM